MIESCDVTFVLRPVDLALRNLQKFVIQMEIRERKNGKKIGPFGAKTPENINIPGTDYKN